MSVTTIYSNTTLTYPGAVWYAGPDPEPNTPITVRGAAGRKHSRRRTNTWKRSHRRAPPAYRGLMGYSSDTSTMIVTNTYYPPPGSAAQWP